MDNPIALLFLMALVHLNDLHFWGSWTWCCEQLSV